MLDQTTARGDISLDTRGARPLVDANPTLTELDLNTYASKGARHTASQKATEKDGKAKSIEDLLQQQAPAEPGPRVQGYTKREGWDEDAYNLAPLGALDANAKLSIGKLTVGAYHLDQSDLNVALKNRVMITTLNQVRLYEGTGTALSPSTARPRPKLISALPSRSKTLPPCRFSRMPPSWTRSRARGASRRR